MLAQTRAERPSAHNVATVRGLIGVQYSLLVRGQRRLFPGAAVVAVAALVGAGLGLAGARTVGGSELPCQPRWFVPSLRFRIMQYKFVQPDVTYTSLWQRGSCRIDPKRPFSYRLSVVGADGVTISSQEGGFSGDMNPGGSGGGGATIRLAKWCAPPPVRVTLTGAGPDYDVTGKGYRLTMSALSIRCQ